MNTIKIYLAEDGSLASLQKDFALYQFEYQNKLLNVYVPTSIVAGPFVDNNITTGYSCQIKMSSVDSNGRTKLTGNFYMRYVKTLTQNGVEYALFERLLPYAFTIYSGEGVNAPQLTISVVNIVMDDNTPQVVGIINSQTCALEVNASTQVQTETPDDPSDLDSLFAMYSDIQDNMDLKQNVELDQQATIDVIQAIITSGTAPVEVEQAFIDLFTRTQTNLTKNAEQDNRLDTAEQDITNIKQTQATGIRIIGTLTASDTLPTQAQLNTFRTSQGYTDETSGDVIWIQLQKTSDTDSMYMATYSLATTLWTITQVQFLENATNAEKGIIQGTSSETTNTAKILFDIQNGKIVDVLAYRNSTWVSIRDYLNTIDSILAGTISVPKATADSAGNNIESTYLTKSAGATKTYVQEYATPRILNEDK